MGMLHDDYRRVIRCFVFSAALTERWTETAVRTDCELWERRTR